MMSSERSLPIGVLAFSRSVVGAGEAGDSEFSMLLCQLVGKQQKTPDDLQSYFMIGENQVDLELVFSCS